MIKARIRWCSCRVENILTLGKLLSLWFCFLLHSILFFISQTSYRTYKIISSYELARPIMGTIFLVNNLLHLVIVKYGDISLVLCISTRLRLVTILSLLVKYLVIFHADPCNKSYIYVDTTVDHFTPLALRVRGKKYGNI